MNNIQVCCVCSSWKAERKKKNIKSISHLIIILCLLSYVISSSFYPSRGHGGYESQRGPQSDGANWDTLFIEGILALSDGKRVVQIPIVVNKLVDRLIWHFHKFGVYDVKTGYGLALGTTILNHSKGFVNICRIFKSTPESRVLLYDMVGENSFLVRIGSWRKVAILI